MFCTYSFYMMLPVFSAGSIIHNIIIIGTKQYPYFIVTTNVVSDMAGLS